jgi:hypothetical protein
MHQPVINTPLFWTKVRKTDYCWFWTGGVNRCGYGIHGKYTGSNKSAFAHRISWELTRSEIPAGKFVLHRCDNRRCVNPSHLYVGTQKDNGRDASVRKRFGDRRGENAPRAKLNNEMVLAIRRRCEAGERKNALAKEFGVTPTHIGYIASRKLWAHI